MPFMCYSAMVQQDAKEIGMKFGVRVQLDMYEDIFTRRAKGEKLTINKAMENPFLVAPKSAQEKHIAEMILKWRKDQITLLEEELFKQQARLTLAERSLSAKSTKKALEEKRIATNKIDQIKFKLKKFNTSDYISEDEKSVFPLSYLSMITVDETGEKIVAPFRYHMRPRGKAESFDRKFSGCYNARLDNLENPFWRPVFGTQHGIVIVSKFYEHVPTEKYLEKFSLAPELRERKSVILSFEPDNTDYMIIPTLWDVNKQKGKPDLYSCAIITDDPPKEIAETGHERCPVFLKPNNIDRWLHPNGQSREELYEILRDRVRPHYSHKLVEAA